MAVIFVKDINQLTKDEWRAERKKGIGGSDVGAILGFNEYKSPFDVYYEKIGAKQEKTISTKARATLEIGNRLEDLVVEMFQERHPSIQVINDTTMYQHEKYPFMFANTDRILILPDGSRAILECKTLSYTDEWENTDFCRGISGKCPLSYEYQGRHYMATLDVDLVIIVGLDLLRKDLYEVYIYRDKEIEQKMIAAEAKFWDLVEHQMLPKFNEQFTRLSTRVKANAFMRFFGANRDIVYHVSGSDEIALFNEMNELIIKQQFYNAQAQKAKEAKEEIAMDLFMLCEKRLDEKPSRIELNLMIGDMTTKQYVTLTDTTAVNFNLQKFVEVYNNTYENHVPEDIDEPTALMLCKNKMPDRMGEFLTLNDKGARFYFSKRKIKVKSKEKKKEYKE